MPYTTSVDVGASITLILNGKEVTLYADDFVPKPGKPLHFGLPEGEVIDLGSLKGFIEWFNANILTNESVKIPSSAGNSWPTFVKNVFNGVLNTNIKINSFSIDKEAKPEGETDEPPTAFKLGVTGTAAAPINLELFQVVGGGVVIERKVTRNTAPAPAPAPEDTGK